MAIINLLPHSTKKHLKSPETEAIKASPKVPRKLLLIASFTILSLFVIRLLLAFQLRSKEGALELLDRKLNSLKSNYREIDALKNRQKELSEKLSFYERLLENNTSWSEKLSLINKAIPDQVWLTSLYTETKPNRVLVIRGSATSSVESEMIDSISQFVNRLKKESVFSRDFTEIKLGNLTAEKKGNISVMNFRLFCKFK